MKKIRVCSGISCRRNGSLQRMKDYELKYNLKRGYQNDKIDLDFCGCTGNCCNAINVRKDNKIFSVYPSGKEVEKIKKEINFNLDDI